MRFKKLSAIVLAVAMLLSMIGVTGLSEKEASAASFQDLNQSQIVEEIGRAHV